VGQKVTVQIDAALVEKLRNKAIADGLPDAHSIPDEELLAALIRSELIEETEPIEPEPIEPEPIEITPAADTVRVVSQYGLNLRPQPGTGDPIKILADQEELTVLDEQNEWLQVRTADGLVGWVSADFVIRTKPVSPLPVPPKGNVRGIHGSAGTVAPPKALWNAWISQLKAMGIAWYKQLDAGDPNDVGGNSTFAWVLKLKQNGIEPIIRYYQGQMFPGRLHDQAFKKMKRYAAAGIVWSEIGNEPNLDRIEWHSNHHGKVSWQNPFYPRTIVENWIRDAERATAAGARPGFYALAPTDWGDHRPHPSLSSVMFYRRMFEHVAANTNLRKRFLHLFGPGKAWLAVHVSTYEWPPNFNPYPPDKPPYDMCLRGYEIPMRDLRGLLGLTNIVVMSTEGGVFTKDSTSMSGHARLHSHQEHAQRTVEMFDWIQKKSPLHAMCPWLISNVFSTIGHSDQAWAHDGWFDGNPPDFGPKPVVGAIKNTKPTF